MSFWESELGEVTGTAADAFAKSIKQIPDMTMALAKIELFSNQEYKDSGFKFLEIIWVLTDGDFKGQKVHQKLKVYGGDKFDKDPAKTRHRALNMLKLLYQLFNVKPKHANDPTDQDLAVFHGKEAGIQIRETEPNKEGKQYNWISEVHDSKGFVCETGISLVVTHVNKQYQDDRDSAFDRYNAGSTSVPEDDIPF